MGERLLQTFHGTQVKRKLTHVGTANKKSKPISTALSHLTSDDSLSPSISDLSPLDKNLKAVKIDGAGVHVHLWNREIARGLSHSLPDNWESNEVPAQCFRVVLLCVWKRRATSSFWTWFRRYCPSSSSPIAIWSAVDKKYQWIDKSVYAAGWAAIHKCGSTSIIAAQEYIWRASLSSWWTWDIWSRPFFWRWNPEFLLDVGDGVIP